MEIEIEITRVEPGLKSDFRKVFKFLHKMGHNSITTSQNTYEVGHLSQPG